jgi:hypothetical protein
VSNFAFLAYGNFAFLASPFFGRAMRGMVGLMDFMDLRGSSWPTVVSTFTVPAAAVMSYSFKPAVITYKYMPAAGDHIRPTVVSYKVIPAASD